MIGINTWINGITGEIGGNKGEHFLNVTHNDNVSHNIFTLSYLSK